MIGKSIRADYFDWTDKKLDGLAQDNPLIIIWIQMNLKDLLDCHV